MDVSIKMKRYHLPLIRTNWPRRLSLSMLCLMLFMLITCFSVSMLVFTQILLSSNQLAESTGIYNLSAQSFHLFSSKIINSRLSLEKFLSNFNRSYEVDDSLLSVGQMPLDGGIVHYVDNYGSNLSKHGHVDHWQPVRSSSNKFFIFSSFIDSYNRSNMNNYLELDQDDHKDYFTRVIAVTTLTTKDKIICSYHPNNHPENMVWFKQGKLKPIREHWNLKYSAFFIYCPLPKEIVVVKNGIISTDGHDLSMMAISGIWQTSSDLSLLLKRNAQHLRTIVPSNRMPIHELDTNDGHHDHNRRRMAVCVKPLHYYYNKTISLIEFIELNRLLGVERFYFYNHTMGMQVDYVIRMYEQFEPGLLNILPWSLPIKSQTEIRTEGIFAALNDCLYRAKTDRFTYVMFIDLDEFIIPYHHRSLSALMQDIQHIYPDKVGAYSFRNGFFYLQYPDDDLETIQPEKKQLAQQLVTLTKTIRKSDLNIHKQRSKCIVFAEDTVEMGNHFVWEFTYGKHTLNIDPNIAYLHHYRVCEFGGDGCIYKTDKIIDRHGHYWAHSLLNAINKRLGWFCANKTTINTIELNACHFIYKYTN